MMILFEALMFAQIGLLFLVAVGFWPMIALTEKNHALRSLAVGFQIWTVAAALRVFWWDMLPIFLTKEGVQTMFKFWAVPNILFASMTITAAVFMLRAIWLLIPPDDRKHWSIFTAPFYPKLRGLVFRKFEK